MTKRLVLGWLNDGQHDFLIAFEEFWDSFEGGTRVEFKLGIAGTAVHHHPAAELPVDE